MAVRLLLDEMVEHEVYHRLQKFGHEVEHVHYHDSLGQGDDDGVLAEYSRESSVLLVTYDDDFEAHHKPADFWGLLLFSDDNWSAREVANTVHEILSLYDSESLQQVNLVGREWL